MIKMEDIKKYQIEEKFKNVITIHRYQITLVEEATFDYFLYIHLYEILTINEIKNLGLNGFTIEYIQPGRDFDGQAFTRIRFRAATE